MTYQEKSLWVSLVSTVVIFGIYFFQAFSVMSDPARSGQTLITYFIIAVVAAIVVQIATQVWFAMTDRKAVEAGMDERDKSIDLKTTRRAYYVLVFGIWISVGTQAFLSDLTMMINILMLSFIIAELVTYVSKLLIYRRGY